MSEGTAEHLVKEFDQLAATRSNWETHWQEIGERVLPRARDFISDEEKGIKKTDKIYDSTAVLALERFAAAMESMLTPRSKTWHTLTSTNEDLNDDDTVKLWFDEVNKILFNARYSPTANFASQNHESYLQLGAFGTGSMFVDESMTGGIRYKSLHLGDLFYAENHQGVIDKVYRRFRYSARQAKQRLDWHGRLPKQIEEAKDPWQEFEFLHIVQPRNDMDPQRADFKGMPFESVYVSITGKAKLSEGGYRKFPYPISRYVTAPNETYGRSPAMTVLPDIKMLNEMSKTDIRAVHKLVDPPILLHDDGILGAGSMSVDLRPNGLNYGGVSADGRQLMQPLQTGARVDIAEEKMERRRQTINDAFLVTLFQILVDNPQMTATEAMLRAQEKGALLTPAMGRQQSEYLGPLIEREIDILQAQGVIPPLPGILAEAGGEYKITYDSPLNRMQRAEEVTAVMQTIEVATPFAQVDPSVMELFDAPEVVRMAAEVTGVPAKVLRSKDEVEERVAAAKAQQSEAMQVAQAQPAAAALKDLAQAQAMSGGG